MIETNSHSLCCVRTKQKQILSFYYSTQLINFVLISIYHVFILNALYFIHIIHYLLRVYTYSPPHYLTNILSRYCPSNVTFLRVNLQFKKSSRTYERRRLPKELHGHMYRHLLMFNVFDHYEVLRIYFCMIELRMMYSYHALFKGVPWAHQCKH